MFKRAGGDLGLGGVQPKRPRTDDINTRVFVGSLSYSTNWQGLKDHFNQVGDVEFASVLLKPDGSSKGCGMVNYRTAEEAAMAVQQLNESTLDGRRIMVKLDGAGEVRSRPAVQPAREVLGQPPRPRAMQEEGVLLPPESISRVFVGNLAFSTTWQAMKDHFKTAGNVEFASVLKNPDQTSKGVGLVNFMTHEEAVLSVQMLNESFLDGRQISVKLDVDGRFKERPPPRDGKPVIGMAPPQPPEDMFAYKLPPEEICRVFVSNLSYGTNWQALKDHFSQAGDIEFASVLLNPDRTSKGVGMVNFRNHADAVRAVEMLCHSELDGRNIMVKLDVDGHFKERPPPGARPRIFQKTQDQFAPAPAGNPLATAQVLSQALTQAGYAASAGRPQMQQQPAVQANSPASTTLDCLNALSALATSPVAGQIDWPNLIKTVANTVASASSAPAASSGGPRQTHFLR